MRLLRVVSVLFAVCLCSLIAVMIFARQDKARARWLAFISLRDGQFDIYMTDIYTGEIQRITDTAATETNIVWSPNASYLLYSLNATTDFQLGTIHVRSGVTSVLLRDRHFITGMAWSGNMIAFDEAAFGEKASIYVMEAGTNVPRTVTSDAASDIHPAFAGESIVYSSVRDDSPAYGLYTTDGEVIIQNHHSYLNPSISPDGRWILASRYSEGLYEIVKINAVSGEEHVIVVPQINPTAPHWSPDGRWIAYVAYETNNFDIFITDGRQVKQITDHLLWDAAPAWMPVVDLAWHAERLSGVVLLVVGLQLLLKPLQTLVLMLGHHAWNA